MWLRLSLLLRWCLRLPLALLLEVFLAQLKQFDESALKPAILTDLPVELSKRFSQDKPHRGKFFAEIESLVCEPLDDVSNGIVYNKR